MKGISKKKDVLTSLRHCLIDPQNRFVHVQGKCAEELKEECGITLESDSLVDMTELAYGSNWKGVYPSAGGCDEFLRLFVSHKGKAAKFDRS